MIKGIYEDPKVGLTMVMGTLAFTHETTLLHAPGEIVAGTKRIRPGVGELTLKVVMKQPTILELEHVWWVEIDTKSGTWYEVGGCVRHGVEVGAMWVAVGTCGSDTSAHSKWARPRVP